MLITNLPHIQNKDYEILGIVEGSLVYSKHLGKDIMAGLKNIAGGELKGYTEMIEGAKKIAMERLKKEATTMGADAVLNIQYSITNLQGGAALVINVVGTGVKYK